MEKIRIENGIGIIPEGTTRIGQVRGQYGGLFTGDTSFKGKEELKKVIIPSSVTTIGCNTFAGCINLEEVEIPDSVTLIDEFAFKDCRNLKNLKLPKSLKEIECRAFDGCVSLSKILIPKSVEMIDKQAFINTDLEEIKVEEGNRFYDSRNNCNGIIAIREKKLLVGCRNTLIPPKITKIGASAFWGCKSLTAIEIPEDVDTIENFAFWGSGLTSLHIPSTVTNIEEAITACCYDLKAITVAKENVFYDSRNDCNAIILSEYEKLIATCPETKLPKGIEAIGSRAFCGCGMKEVVLFKKVKRIDDYAFYLNTEPINVTFPDNAFKTIGKGLFYKASGLSEFVVPEGVTKIDRNAFYGCTSLSNLSLPYTLTEIGREAFKDCKSLPKIEIPDSVENVGCDAFEGCANLMSVKISRRVRILEVGVFQGCVNLRTMVIPRWIREIRMKAFANCKKLEELVIPESVTFIDRNAFEGCTGLKNITIDAPINFEDVIFDDCKNVQTLTFGPNIKKLDSFWGDWADNLETIYIPPKKKIYFKNRIPEKYHAIIKEKE